MKHIPQLDSLRAIAVFLVLFWHWLPASSAINVIDNGALGVDIFFVLSGFLISGILLRERKETGTLPQKLAVFKNFYARRALRILPVYFLLVLVILTMHEVLSAELSTKEFFAAITFTSNFLFFNTEQWGNLTIHFWTLAVEEQFYLVWPFVILLSAKKSLLPMMLMFVAIGLLTPLLTQSPEFGHIPTYTCLDAFGLGGVLAWMVFHRPDLLRSSFIVSLIGSFISLAILITQIKTGKLPFLHQRLFHSVIAFCTIDFILLSQQKKTFAFSFILNSKTLQWIGRISYGIYLYHVPVQWFQYLWSEAWDNLFPAGILHRYSYYFIFLINSSIVLIVAALSWKFFESPILKLKKRFSYFNRVGR